MSKLKLYNVSDDYVDYLKQYDHRVFSSKEDDRNKERKYLGVVLNINNCDYFVPLSSPKESDYKLVDNIKTIRKDIIPIIRIVVKNSKGKDELKGTLKFSNMIPVPSIALINYDVNSEKDELYKILVLKEIDFINSNSNRDKIIKNAKVIYNQKVNNWDIGYIKQTVDFKLLEQKSMEYASLFEVASSIDDVI